MEKERRNHSAGKWQPRLRVAWNAQQTPREISIAFGERRNIREPSYSFASARALVVGKKESSIFANWTTKREAKLIAYVFRFGLGGGREKVARIEGCVTVELVKGAVKFVGAGFENHVYLRTRVSTEGGIVSAGCSFKLLDGIDRRTDRKSIQ